MNKNTNFDKLKFILYPLTSYLSCWLLIAIIMFIFHNVIECDTCIVLCDNAGNSIDQFFMDDEDRCDNINKNNNKNNYFPDSSPYAHIYCSNVMDRYKNIGKRKLYWFIAQKGKGNFPSYEEYKKSWNSNINIISELKKQFKSELENTSHKVSLTKRSLSWFIRGSKPGGGRGL